MPFCWFSRRAIAHDLDGDKPLSKRTRLHLRSCPACQAFYQTQKQIIERLTAEADGQRSEPSPFLQAKILKALDRPPLPEYPRRGRFGWAVATFAFTLGLVGMVAVMRWQNPNTEADAAFEPLAGSWVLLPGSIPDGRKLLEWSQALEQPLETELESVVSDARTAVRLLADNFLPENLLAVNTASPVSP